MARRSKGGESLLRKAREALENRDFEAAEGYAERVLAGEDQDADAHLLAFLAGRHITTVDDLSAVAEQIVAAVPTVATPLAEVLAAEEGEEDAPHADVAELLAQNPTVHAPYDNRLDGLHQAKAAFDAVFEDPDWQQALSLALIEENRHMARAREAAEQVFSDAFAAERAALDAACKTAKVRVPRTVQLAADARKACDDAREDLDQRSGARKDAVNDRYSFLHRNIKTAHTGLRVGIVILVLGVLLLALSLIPSTGTTTNPLASFSQYSIPGSLVVIVIGVGMLMARTGLAKDNQDRMAERVQAGNEAQGAILRAKDELGTRIAAVEACINALEWVNLCSDGFDAACRELDRAVRGLSGEVVAELEDETPEPGEATAPEEAPEAEAPAQEAEPAAPATKAEPDAQKADDTAEPAPAEPASAGPAADEPSDAEPEEKPAE